MVILRKGNFINTKLNYRGTEIQNDDHEQSEDVVSSFFFFFCFFFVVVSADTAFRLRQNVSNMDVQKKRK